MAETKTIEFIDHEAVKGSEDRYVTITVDVAAVLKSWRQSLFSFEWLDKEGNIRDLNDLPEAERAKRIEIEEQIDAGEPVQRPILGMGLKDHVEMGAARATFLTLAAHGVPQISVHIPKSNADDFGPYMS